MLARTPRADPGRPGVEGDAVWWQDGRIRGVGRAAAIDRQAPKHLPRFDLPDALVTPGLRGRPHPLRHVGAGSAAGAARRRATRAEAVARVAAGTPSQGWVAGPRLGRQRLDRAPGPPRARPGAREPGLPRFARRARRLGEQRGARGRPGHPGDAGSPRRPDRARRARASPPGCCWSAPWSWSRSVVPPPSDEILDEALREAQAEAHRLGVTGIHDVEDERAWRAFRRLEEAGDLAAPGAVPPAGRVASRPGPPGPAERGRHRAGSAWAA